MKTLMTGSEYLAKVRSLPCCICDAFGMQQRSPTAAHHVFHDRFSQTKAADRDTIPLCEGHHQGLWDQSKVAIHKEKKRWRALYGADHQYIEVTQDKVARA